MNSKERENFLRNSILVVDNAREALALTRQQDINQKYKMESIPRGFVLIINNIHFHNHKHRPGAQQDREKLKAMFEDFGFRVYVNEDQTAREIEDLLSAFSLRQDLHRVDSLIVVLMSHGNDEVILGTDCQRLNVISLIKKFNADYCPAMMGKPKMFIVNACRGDDVDCNPILRSTSPSMTCDITETDAGPTSLERKRPANSDFLIAYSTFPGYVSLRDEEEGSWFIQCLEEVFRESASEEHVIDMLTQVNDRVASKSESMMGYNQTPAPSTTLRYKWFLNPRNIFHMMELNFIRMGIIFMNILTDILYDRLNLDGQNVPLRSKCNFTYLYNEHRKLYLHKASNLKICSDGPWGETWQDIENLDLAIGDDIERIRLIRNELFNTSTYELEETRYNELCNIIRDLSGRFDQHNKPSLLYSDRMKEMIAKVISDEEAKKFRKYIENEIADKDDVVPTEIKLMSDKSSVPIYLKLLESGSEKKRDIRLVIVGKKGAGKTSLLKRLFGEELGAVDSTNGIEIHRIKCKTRSTGVNWKKINSNNEEFERNSRLLIPYRERLTFQKEVADSHATPSNQHEEKVTTHYIGTVETSEQGADRNSINNNTTLSSEEILYSRTASDQPEKVALRISHKAGKLVSHVTVNETEKQQSNLSVDQANEEIKEMLNSEVDFNDKNEYATLLLWDFAGDKEFYHTHQTFLSPDSIYVVVTNLNEADNKEAQGIFRLWMDSIHCYCRPNELSCISTIDTKSISDDPLDPPVILVGTWKDQVQITAEKEIMDVCHETLYKFAEDVSEDACRHIRDEYTHFVSNTDDDDTAFQPIREHILQLARTMKTWNTNYPLKFIQLEKRLQEKKKELPIVSLHDLKLITSETQNPLNNEELMLFLKFHHEIRALIFFEDLSDYIILDTQWLSNAFKVVVTAEKFQKKSIKNIRKWDEFYSSGKLHSFVLKDMFKNEPNMLSEYKDYILNVMEKFDIIIRQNILDKDTGNEESCYYVPCIIKHGPKCDIYTMLNATADTCQKSTWLCFKFTFLPPHLMNHLIASLCRRYKIAELVDSRQTKKRIALFKGTVVFEVDRLTELQKLIVITRSDLIQMQILEFGTSVVFGKGVYKLITKFVTKEINKIINTRFKMTNLKFSRKWECGLAQPDSVTGCRDFGEQHIIEYNCGMCRQIHKAVDEWSDLPTESLRQIHHAQGSDPQTETLAENKTVISTKVYVKGMTSVSTNVSGVAGIGDTNNKLSNEEKNFTRMGMTALNILADVLYDLLKLDGQNVNSRSEYDITQLYNKHRNLNKHKPSNSSNRYNGPWGGAWHHIQNTDTAIGDDIERIRLTRNELQHSSTYALKDARFNELCDITHDMLGRFERHNRPTKLYSCRFKEVLATIISDEEAKNVRQQFECKIDTETAFQIEVLHELHEPPKKKTKHEN